MDETVRREGVEYTMRTVIDAMHDKGMVPLVLLAGDSQHIAIMPCGPGTKQDQVEDLILKIARAIKARRVHDGNGG